jgi:hypothetical protein
MQILKNWSKKATPSYANFKINSKKQPQIIQNSSKKILNYPDYSGGLSTHDFRILENNRTRFENATKKRASVWFLIWANWEKDYKLLERRLVLVWFGCIPSGIKRFQWRF